MSNTINLSDLDIFEEESQSKSSINLQKITSIFIINWKWFILSMVICLGMSVLYLKYTKPTYQTTMKILIKDSEDNRSRSAKNALANIENLGIMSNSAGIDNEVEILASHSIAIGAVKKLKLYVSYEVDGKLRKHTAYRTQPFSADMSPAALENLEYPMKLELTREGSKYHVTGKYVISNKLRHTATKAEIDTYLSSVPGKIHTRMGDVFFSLNPESAYKLRDGEKMYVTIISPLDAATMFVNKIGVEATGKNTSIAQVTITDSESERALDYLSQLAESYNEEANNDKNEIAIRTEEFINSRLEKIAAELGNTEGKLESYKRQNNVVDMKLNAQKSLTQSSEYEKALTQISTQMALISSVNDFINTNQHQYKTLPANVGIEDESIVRLINDYNKLALERKRMLMGASENSPMVLPITEQLTDLAETIRHAISQAKRNLEIEQRSLLSQYNKYTTEVQASPSQERMLISIGRQQEVSSGLYLMLLQKREENSISLAATANKGKIIDFPKHVYKVSPKTPAVLLAGFLAGILIPFLIFFIIELIRYRIEGHDDVETLVSSPIVGDIPIASEEAKQKAGIVVREDTNFVIDEVFRLLRTNILFTLKENEKVIMLTSSISGEGKTFIASNLAMSLAIMGKKVVLVGLDIRRPRLAELFGLRDKVHGISTLLTKSSVTLDDIKSQIIPSGVSDNLELLMAGPIPPNPAELIMRKSLDETFEILQSQYDYIIVDTAPIGLVSDTINLGRIANSTVYVCRADYTPKSALRNVNTLIEQKKLSNVSIAINAIDFSKKKYGYYYGYGSYGKYGKYGNYGSYGNYTNSYGTKGDTSIKK